MKALDPIKDAEFIQRHEMCARDAAVRREKLWAAERANNRTQHESHSYPESETPSTQESWDDLP
jgi:hypothetical protein